MRMKLANQAEVSVYRSSLTGGWNWHLLISGRIVAGGVGFATESAAFADAMAH